MRKISFYTTVSVFVICMQLQGSQNESKDILDAMTFPEAEIEFGKLLNNPFFTLNINKRDGNPEEIKESILKIKKELEAKNNPELYYKLGNYFSEINEIDNAVSAFKKYIEHTSSEEVILSEDIKKLQNTGDAYLSLYDIDLNKNKADYLEKSLLYFTKAVELNPQDMDTWRKLGDCYLLFGKTTESLYCYSKIADTNPKDFEIYMRLQAASFQSDYLKIIKSMQEDFSGNLNVEQGFNYDYLETAINNSPAELKEILKLQHNIYLLRLMVLNDEYNRNIVKKNPAKGKSAERKDNDKIISAIEKMISSLRVRSINNESAEYLSGIVNYLKKDYKRAITDFKEILKSEKRFRSVYDDILFINMTVLKDDSETKKTAEEIIHIFPSEKYYLLLAEIEFRKKNYSGAEMLCSQSLKFNTDYTEAYSGLAVVYAENGNYIAAEEMIKKGNSSIKKQIKAKKVHINLKVNEAAVALLKNEKERAYILLRSVLSVDNNDKARKLYNRYFIKNE